MKRKETELTVLENEEKAQGKGVADIYSHKQSC